MQPTLIICTILLTLLSHTALFAQNYKIIPIHKDTENRGTITKFNFPATGPIFSFLDKTKAAKDAKVMRTTSKIILFQIDLKEYAQYAQLFISVHHQNVSQRPLISAFYDTSAQINSIPEKECKIFHEWLNAKHLLSARVDTSRKYLYLVMAFPNAFSAAFTYSIQCKTKTNDMLHWSRYRNTLYRHPYDYQKQARFFMESRFFEPDFSYPHFGINLNDAAFEKPHIQEGSDSLFYHEWMIRFLELVERDKAYLQFFCNPTDAKLEMHFDTRGKIIHHNVSSSSPLMADEAKVYDAYVRLLNESFPTNFTWTPALDIEGKAIEYKRVVYFEADFCLN